MYEHNSRRPTAKSLHINRPIGVCFNLVKNPFYENLILGKHGYVEYLGEDCQEWFVNEMLEIKTHMKH